MKYEMPPPTPLEQQAREMTKYRNEFLRKLRKIEAWSRKHGNKIVCGLLLLALSLPSCNNWNYIEWGAVGAAAAGLTSFVDLGVTTTETPQANLYVCVLGLPISLGWDFDGYGTGFLGGKFVVGSPLKCNRSETDHTMT